MKNIPPHIFKLIANYISKEIKEQEFQILKQWINENEENRQLFSNYLHIYKKSRGLKFLENIDEKKAWSSIGIKLVKPLSIKPVQIDKKINRFRKNVFKYAALITLFFCIGYLYTNGYFQEKSKNIKPTSNITLQLENGDLKIIKEDGSFNVLDANGNIVGEQSGVQLVYDKTDKKKKVLEYNTLTIPYGKRFELKLSDGTNVHLNAGTSLKYPVNFIKGENRKVFLLSGEAYFDVAKDVNHPFVVNKENMNIRVLGTQFNVSSYPEDDNINTVLVEGAVSIYKNDESYNPEKATILKPGFKAAWLKNNQEVSVEKADIEMHTAWIGGRVIFRRTPFENIIKKLERHYNVVIINNNSVLAKQEFGASFSNETIEEVLESFSANSKIEYTINKNQITIH